MAFFLPKSALVPIIFFANIVASTMVNGTYSVPEIADQSSSPLYQPPLPSSSISYADYPGRRPFVGVEDDSCCWIPMEVPPQPSFRYRCPFDKDIPRERPTTPQPAPLLTPGIHPQDREGEGDGEAAAEEEAEEEVLPVHDASDGGSGERMRPAGQLFDRLKSEVEAKLSQPNSTSASAGTSTGTGSGANGTPKASPVTPAQAQYNTALRAISEEDGDDSRVNFAAKSSGAKVLASASGANNPAAILSENQDSYLWAACNVRLWVIIELSQAIYVDTIVLGSYEYYSSTIYEFEIWGSAAKLTEESAAGWTLLGNFTTATSVTANGQGNNGTTSDGSDGSNGSSHSQNRHHQRFLVDVEKLDSVGTVRYLLIKPLTYHGKGPVCTLSVIRIFGMTHTERVRAVQSLQHAAKKPKNSAGSNGHNGASTHRTQTASPTSASVEINESENLENGTAVGNAAFQHHNGSSQSTSVGEAADSGYNETSATIAMEDVQNAQGHKSDNGEPLNGRSTVDDSNDAGDINGHDTKNKDDSEDSASATENSKNHQINGYDSKDGHQYSEESSSDGKNGTMVGQSGTGMDEGHSGHAELDSDGSSDDKEHERLESEISGMKPTHSGNFERENATDVNESGDRVTAPQGSDDLQHQNFEVPIDDIITDNEESLPKFDTEEIDISLSPSVEISMEFGDYEELLESVRGLHLSQSVLENTVRALDGDYAIYFNRLDNTIVSLKTAWNRSRNESEDLAQDIKVMKNDYEMRIAEMQKLFQQLSATVSQLDEKITNMSSRAHEKKFSFSSLYNNYLKNCWAKRYSWIACIRDFVYSRRDSVDGTTVLMAISAIVFALLLRQTRFRWGWPSRVSSSPDRYQFCIERLELLARHNETEIRALAGMLKERVE